MTSQGKPHSVQNWDIPTVGGAPQSQHYILTLITRLASSVCKQEQYIGELDKVGPEILHNILFLLHYQTVSDQTLPQHPQVA